MVNGHTSIEDGKDPVKPKLLGTYKYAYGCPTHALVEREPKKSDNPKVGVPMLRSMCNIYSDVYRSDGDTAYPAGNEEIVSKVTCTTCLNKLRSLGMLPPEKENKKFFLVTYSDNSMSIFSLIAELNHEIKERREEIVRIRLIDSYRMVSMETMLVNEDGGKITKEDLL